MNILGLIDLPDILVLITIVLTALYFHVTKDDGLFKALGVPGPKPLPLLGNRAFFKLPVNERYTKLREKYGQIYGIFFDLGLTSFPSVSIGNLEMAREISIKEFSTFRNRSTLQINEAQVPPVSLNLFSIDGDYWKTLRTIMAPSFTSGKLKKMVGAINTTSKTLVSCLKTPADNKEKIVARKFTGAFTMDVIASVMMGVDLDCQNNPDDKFVKNVQESLQAGQNEKFLPTLWLVAIFPFLAPLVHKWTRFMGWKDPFFDDGPIRFFEKSINEILAVRQTSNKKYADFLQLMHDAKISTSSGNVGDGLGDGLYHKTDSTSFRELSRDELVAQCFLFFLAGHETTAAGLMFSFYLLALFPEIQDRLVAEINEHVTKNTDPDYETVGKCKYLEMFIMETLRLYPSIGASLRTAGDDIRVGQYYFPKGTNIIISIWQIHHDPDIWENPEMFDPERFHPDNRAKHHPAQWMPFGIGPRQCLGMRLALLEMKIALIHVIRQYKISKCDKTEIPLKLGTTDIIGAVETPVYVQVENRSVE